MRVCSICHHRKLAQIDHALLAGQTQAAVARKYSVSPDAVNRHTRHMQTAIAQAVAAREPNRGNDIAYGNALLDELGRIKASVEHVEQEAENARDWRTLLMATKQRADLVKLQADLTGQVEGTRNLNVNVDMQVDEATAQRIVSAYLLTHGRPQDAPQGEATCNHVQERTKDQLGETLSLCRVSLGAYCAAMLPNFQTPPHVQLIIRKLEMLEAGIIRRLIICLPPRCGKTMAAQMAMAWTMGRDPTRSIIASGYAQELADDTGRRVRNLLNSAMHQAIFPGCRLAGDSQAMQRFATTANGAFYAAGRGASITGRGADFLLLDDMLKDYEEACSQAIRKGVWDWFQSVAYPRLEPGGRVLVIGTRWATSDLIGQILAEHKGEGWELVSLPALAEPGDVLGRPEGAPIWPERYDREALESIKRQIGGRMFASLYMQDPVMSSGNLFRRNWWRYYREAPQEGRLVLSLDSAFKTGKENDFSAWTLWRAAKDGYYLLHAGRDRLEFPELKRMLNNLAAVWHPHLLLVEDAASGQSLLQELRRDTALPLKAIRPDKDKLARAAAITPLIECGRTYLPEAAPWLEDYLDELSAFPSGAHDDWTDSTTQFLNYVRVVQPGAVTINFWTGSGRSLDWGEYSAMDWVSWQLWQSAR